MPLKQNDLATLQKQTSIRKMLAFFLDYLFLTIIGLILTITAVTPILKSTKTYKNSYNEMEIASVECYKVQCEARLSIKKDEKSILNETELFGEYVNSHILLSYVNNTSQFNAEGITIEDTSKKATFDNDYIGFYYSKYKLDKNIKVEDYNGKTGNEYFISLVKENGNSFFDYPENELPSLKAEVAIDLYRYKNNGATSSYYSSFKEFFINLNRKALIELSEYAPYKVEYDKFTNGYESICGLENKSLFVIYSILFVGLILLPKLISGNGFTLGNYITKTRIRYEKNKWLSLSIDTVLSYILMFTTVGFIGLISFGIAALSVKLFYNVTVLTFVLASLIILIIDFVLTCFVPKNITLVELASFETFVDVHKSVKEETLNNEKN